jgi:hypothetical protein
MQFCLGIMAQGFNLFGWGPVVPRDLLTIFQKFSVGRENGKWLKGLLSVWHAVVWSI